MRVSMRELSRRYGQEDVELAKVTQTAQRRVGAPVQSLNTILTGKAPPQRPTAPADLTERQLRKRGRYGQAALLLDQQALQEPDLTRATMARQVAAMAKELAHAPIQLEFDFWKGNFTMSFNYVDVMNERIVALQATSAKKNALRAAILLLARHVRWASTEVEISAAELGDQMEMHKAHVSRLLDQLEDIGAIYRVKKGRNKIIYVNPEGVYRGKMDADNHGKAVERFAGVVDFKARAAREK